MAGDLRLSATGLTGYMGLILIGFFVWVGVPVVNRTFGTHIMTFERTLAGTTLAGNVLLGGFLVLVGLISYLGFRI